MKKTVTITLNVERILELKLLEDGTYDVLLEVEEESTVPKSEKKEAEPVISDADFVLIEAENLSLDDEFMKHEPRSADEKEMKELIKEAILKGVKNFSKPRGDVSFTEDGNGICYAPGNMPAVGKSYSWHKRAAKEFYPKRNSRLGSRLEYGAFLGVLIKKLIEEGETVKWAWNAVCNDSCELGHYVNSENAKHDLEMTGSREICGFCDLSNVNKILAWDDENDTFWTAGGCYQYKGNIFPLAELCDCTVRFSALNKSVGWLVLS